MKTKILFIQAFCILVSTSAFSQWQATNASSATNNVIQDFCEHNNSIYHSSYEGLKKWDSGSDQWNTVSFTGFQLYAQEYIEDLASTGDYLYATKWNAFCASHMVYKSNDDGATFVADTAGLPRNGACDSVPNTILAFFALPNGNLVAEFGANFYTKSALDASWVIDNSLRRFMTSGTNAWYRLNSNALYKSTDSGLTWTTTATTSFPIGMQPSVLEVNSETGRIYMNAKYGFNNLSLYSDNEGTTWDTLPVNNFLANSWMGVPQIVSGLIAKGDLIVLGADQNANPSHPDVLISMDGGQTFSADTIGLPSNSGIAKVTNLHFYNDELFMVLNSSEIYRKTGVLNLADKGEKSTILIYPNPVKDKLCVKGLNGIQSAELFDLKGKILLQETWSHSFETIDLSELESGIYILKVKTETKEEIHRIIKH